MDGTEQVVVPLAPGPLRPVRPAARDDLDELIDEMLPDTNEGPGRFDGLLLVAGGGLLAWGTGLGGPEVATVFGALALGLGCILPARWVWRSMARRRSRAEIMTLDLGDSETRRLADAYERVRALVNADAAGPSSLAGAGLTAAHAALVEVATLLRGRPPAHEAERQYVSERAEAIDRFSSSLTHQSLPLLEARRELEELGGTSSLKRLRELTDETGSGDG